MRPSDAHRSERASDPMLPVETAARARSVVSLTRTDSPVSRAPSPRAAQAVSPAAGAADDTERDATQIVRDALNHWRGLSSYGEMTMIIHRPDWERSMSMRSWTQGDKTSLVRVTEPAKDAGNGTLLKDDNMWTYSPKINRIIKIPSSMMNQSWMGSDFTNKDISKSTDIIDQYDHRLLETRSENGHEVYVI